MTDKKIKSKNKHGYGAVFVVVLFALAGLALLLSSSAANINSLYTYDFRNANATIANEAAAYEDVQLTMTGSWSSNADGVDFDGNTSGVSSVGFGKPDTGYTVDVPGSQAVGATAIFTYEGPAPGTCFTDSQNLTQIGAFGNNQGQIKLQVSKCRQGTNVNPQCRIAGLNTPTSAFALSGNYNLVDGETYRLECIKGPDAGANASVYMRLQRIVGGTPAETYQKTFTIPDTGRVRTAKHLSAGNKYPLPAPHKNTDQFIGTLTKVSFCSAGDVAAARTCLDEEISLAAENMQPEITSDVTNEVATQAVGDSTTYQVYVQNDGDADASGVALTVLVDSELDITSAAGGTINGQTITYDIGTLGVGAAAVYDVVATLLPSATTQADVTVSYQVTAADNACNGAGSICDGFDVDSVESGAISIELVQNTSIETDLTGWTGRFGNTPNVTVTRSTEEAHDGSASIKVAGVGGANIKSGFNDRSTWLPSVEAGVTYDASLQFKPQFSGQKIQLKLREWNGQALVNDETVTYTASGTDWQLVESSITGTATGNRVTYIVIGLDIDNGEQFYIDSLSLTRPQ